MKISNYLLITIIIILSIILTAQNRILIDRTEKYIGFENEDILKIQTIDSLQNVIDSLHAENFPCQIELGRYEVAYKIFMERNPKAAQQYGTIISEETE